MTLSMRAAATSAFAMLVLMGGASPLLAQRISNAPTGQPVGGISCDEMEGQRIHIHQHLLILDHGKPVAVPNDVGRPASGQCLYWVHTHTPDGVIHIESPANRTFTLGDFFAIWGQPLNETLAATAYAKGSKLKVWVDGQPYAGNPAKIPLARHTDIVIEAGPPFTEPPPKFIDWGGR